ncbi:MAG: class I SAM-dependent methyltransferase [Desulfobacteraceae bacterium]|nr:class I SAM-dependent methyltransferase [Desulfobacteraceae bacterium]
MTVKTSYRSVFDSIADAYDRWYDAPEGKLLFQEEVDCLRCLENDYTGRWLEVGVGTGRFAEALGCEYGVDLSLPMASKAAQRGIHVCVGGVEQLPFEKRVFDGVLMALALCFLENPEKALRESAHVLREKGKLVIGTIPADSPWGKAYLRKGAEGHPVYAHARFQTLSETVHLVQKLGFKLRRGCSALLWGPENHQSRGSKVETGIVSGAGFVGLLFERHPGAV